MCVARFFFDPRISQSIVLHLPPAEQMLFLVGPRKKTPKAS